MAEIETIKNIANKALCQGAGTWLWERACRVVQNTKSILNFEELANANIPIDNFCLIAAGYFADSGLAYNRGQNKAQAVDVEAEQLVKLSAKMVNEKLGPILTPAKLMTVNNIITETGSRFTKLPEAMILSDAKNLDDMGAVGIMREFRKYAAQGKGTMEFIMNWKRKLDYQYWDARLKESFRFKAVGLLAKQRFTEVQSFIRQLEDEISARDIKEIKMP